MCAIVDANVRHQLFDSGHEAGVGFREWLRASGHAGIAVGGRQYRRELYGVSSDKYRSWYHQIKRAVKTIELDDDTVDDEARILQNSDVCCSDDEHIIALARVSGARLLYSNDKELHTDFKDKKLVDKPLGKVYSTLHSNEFNAAHERLLSDPNLCRPGSG